MTIQEQLEIFIKQFRIGRVMLYDDFLTIKVARGFARSVAKDANEKIEALGLNLVAIPTNFLADDVISIQSNEIGYV